MKHFAPKLSLSQLRKVKGTDYRKWSPSRTKLVIIDGMPLRVSSPLTEGNSKLDKGILIFDLLAVYTCMNCRDCRNTCYALKSQRQYPATWNKRLINTLLALKQLGCLEGLIREQLKRTKKRIVRIHSSGDFINPEYLDMWVRIASKFPKITFYGYTKVDHILNFDGLDALPNVNIVRSVLPDGSLNYGSLEYIEKMRDTWCASICPVTVGVEGAKCGVTCNLCMTKCNRYIVFKEH